MVIRNGSPNTSQNSSTRCTRKNLKTRIDKKNKTKLLPKKETPGFQGTALTRQVEKLAKQNFSVLIITNVLRNSIILK